MNEQDNENSLFSNESSDICMPGMADTDKQQENNHEDLITDGVEEALTHKEVKQVLVASLDEAEYPSYLLDMTNVSNITEESLRAVQGLLAGGNTALYVKNKSIVMRIGYGEEAIFYSILHSVVNQMYGGQCQIYKNRGRGFEAVKENEVDSVRLNL